MRDIDMNRCLACGAPVDGEVCDSHCAAVMDAQAEHARHEQAEDYAQGVPQPCRDCGEPATTWNEVSRPRDPDASPDAWRCADCWRCERCGCDSPEPPDPEYVAWRGDSPRYCDSCWGDVAEAAHERELEDYYGGSGPQTVGERYQQDAAQKRRLR